MQIIPERRRFRAAGDKRTNELQFSSDSAARDGDDDVDEVGRCIRYSFISWCPTNQPLQAAAASVQLKSRPQKEGSMALACPTRRPPPPAKWMPAPEGISRRRGRGVDDEADSQNMILKRTFATTFHNNNYYHQPVPGVPFCSHQRQQYRTTVLCAFLLNRRFLIRTPPLLAPLFGKSSWTKIYESKDELDKKNEADNGNVLRLEVPSLKKNIWILW